MIAGSVKLASRVLAVLLLAACMAFPVCGGGSGGSKIKEVEAELKSRLGLSSGEELVIAKVIGQGGTEDDLVQVLAAYSLFDDSTKAWWVRAALDSMPLQIEVELKKEFAEMAEHIKEVSKRIAPKVKERAADPKIKEMATKFAEEAAKSAK